jgi:hypothetical protein
VPAADRVSQRERDLVRLGQVMGRAVLPGPIGTGLATALHEAQAAGDSLTLIFETATSKLLAMPFEATRLADGRVLALEPGVRVLRRFTPASSTGIAPLSGPLRLLVAVGAPDEGQTANVMLDHEAELQTILDAVEPARQQGNAAVRILEVAHPHEIQRALLTQHYHVLHISGHGRADMIEMEDEDGRAVAMTAADLVDAIRQSGRRVPLIVLASCLSGAGDSDTVSVAQGLLEHGMPMVLAMQSSVSDWYSTRLVSALYQHLSEMQVPLVSHALALARHEVETQRRQARDHGQQGLCYQAEYATPSLFCLGTEYPVWDRVLPREALLPTPQPPVATQVPLLSIGDLIGRRAVLRRVLRVLRDDQRTVAVHGRKAGVLLTGLGGVGKSALAGRVMARLSEQGWTPIVVVGRWGLGELAMAIGAQLIGHQETPLDRLGQLLIQTQLPDVVRLQQLHTLLARHQVLLVLDNFEDNLPSEGGNFTTPLPKTFSCNCCRPRSAAKCS